MARVAGWRPDEFWAATPADVRAVLAGWVDRAEEPCFDGAALAATTPALRVLLGQILQGR